MLTCFRASLKITLTINNKSRAMTPVMAVAWVRSSPFTMLQSMIRAREWKCGGDRCVSLGLVTLTIIKQKIKHRDLAYFSRVSIVISERSQTFTTQHHNRLRSVTDSPLSIGSSV